MEDKSKPRKKSLKYCCICPGIYRGKVIDGRNVTLHRFPKNKRLNRVWVQRCKTVMRTFQLNENRLLCSEHFHGQRGPTSFATLPTIFPTQSGVTKHFPTMCLDDECAVQSSEFMEDVPLTVNDTEPHILNDDEDCAMDIELAPFGVPDADTMMDVSVHLHDYCEGPVPKPVKSSSRSSMVQTYVDARYQGTQTLETQKISVSKTSSTQTTNITADKSTQCNLPVLTYEDVRDNPEQLSIYTGIPNRTLFDALFDELKEEAEVKTSRRKLNYSEKAGGRPRTLSLLNEFFMVLMRLRLGLLLEDLANRFCMSSSQCSDIINRWIDFLSYQLSFLVYWPSKETVKINMPPSFKEKFPDTRVVIDCTEIFTETPSSLKLKSLMYSDYKSHMTYKALVGISPNGVVTFVSDLWCGSISDKQITSRCGILDLCSEGDAIMADKGFTISDLTTPKGIKLILPPFKKRNEQFHQKDVIRTKDIASCRIHVERQMERIKNFRILQGNIPITMAPRASKVFKICTYLTNLLPPLVQK